MLKYLFKAIYTDGETYEQTPEDVSRTDPKRSCFFDIDQTKIARFELHGANHVYAVDLQDGHFEIDGLPFVVEEQPAHEYRLIFFRQHTHSFNVGAGNNDELTHDIVYRFGWQANNEKGENIQKIIQIT